MDPRRIGGVLQEVKLIKGETGNCRILPLDITMEILSFLPAKSLVRFRRVCKLWHSITQEPYFIETHLRKTHARPPTILLFSSYALRFVGPKFAITGLDCCDDPSARLNPKQVITSIRNVVIYASCNGLLCLSHYATTILVVNPAMGDSLTLPPCTHNCGKRSRPHMFYFGFEPVTKEYKVFGTFTDSDALVFTLGTDSAWRQVHLPLDFRTVRLYALALKGAIYWLGNDRGERALRFDLKDECFHRITLPSFKIFYGGRNYVMRGDFTELLGSLCLPVFDIMSGSDIRPRMDIWVRTSSNNVKQEWSINYSIMFPWDVSWQLTPLLIRNDKILVHDYQRGSTRLRYHDLCPNSNGGDNSYKEVFKHNKNFYMTPFVYVESLVPLPH